MSAASIIVELLMKTGSFETDTKRAESSLKRLKSTASNVSNGLKALAGVVSVGAFVAYSKSLIDAGENMQNLSYKTGVSVKELASLQLIAQQSETDMDTLGKSLGRLAKSIGEAEGGSKEIGKALKSLGITTKDPVEGLLQLADAYAKSTDKTKLAADMSQIMGKQWMELVPLLAQGRDEIQRSMQASAAYAEQQAKFAPQAAAFNDQLDMMKLLLAQTTIGFLQSSGVLAQIGNITKWVGENMAFLTKAVALTAGAFAALYATSVIEGIFTLTKSISATAVAVNALISAVLIWQKVSKSNEQNKTVEGQIERIKWLQAEIDKVTAKQIAAKKEMSDWNPFKKGVIDGYTKEIQIMNDEIGRARGQLTGLLKDYKAPPNAPATPDLTVNIPKPKETIPTNMWAETTADLAAFIKKVTEAQQSTKALSTSLGEELNLFYNLDPALKAYLQTMVANVKANEDGAKAVDLMAKKVEDLHAVLKQTPTGQLEEQRKKIKELYEAYDAMPERFGKTVEEQQRVFKESVDVILGRTKETTDTMTEFWKEAAKNMQDAMSGFFFDIMQGKMSDLAGSFKSMIDRMVANLLASQLLSFLTGDFGKTGKMGGVIGDIFKGFPKFASGTNYVPNDMLAVVHKGEAIIPASMNKGGGGGGGFGGPTINFVLNGPVDSRTQSQIAASVYTGMSRAARRNL